MSRSLDFTSFRISCRQTAMYFCSFFLLARMPRMRSVSDFSNMIKRRKERHEIASRKRGFIGLGNSHQMTEPNAHTGVKNFSLSFLPKWHRNTTHCRIREHSCRPLNTNRISLRLSVNTASLSLLVKRALARPPKYHSTSWRNYQS